MTGPAYVCEELLNLHGIDFHDNPLLVVEMFKFSLGKSNPYYQFPLQPPSIPRVIHNYGHAVKILRYFQIAYQTQSAITSSRLTMEY